MRGNIGNKALLLLGILLGMGGCASKPEEAGKAVAVSVEEEPLTVENAAAPNEVLEGLEPRDYRIGPGDVVELVALAVPEISREYTVGPDGKISIPILGVIDAEGQTREALTSELNERLAKVYREPSITVIVREYNNNEVFVLGEVNRPGAFTFKGRPMLLGALAQAQGLSARADHRQCSIVRGRGTLIRVNLYDLLSKGNRDLNVPLLPGDTVYVPSDEEHTFYVLGEVNSPGVYSIGRDMNVVRALSTAGGPTEDGIVGKVRLIRRENGEARMFTLDVADIFKGKSGVVLPVESGDIVYVSRRGIASFNYILRQISPALNTALLGFSVHDALED
jgi:polysaccharide export outer membrane protein